MGGHLINKKLVDSLHSATPKAIDEVALYLTFRLGDRSARTHELGDAKIDEIKLFQTADEIHLSFRLSNEKHNVVRNVKWHMVELLAYPYPVTLLLEKELEEAIVDLLIQDETKVRSILRKAAL